MRGILLNFHLGLGDAIICNAIVRHLAAQHKLVCIPCKYHNANSVQFMFRDLTNLVIRPVEDSDEAEMFRTKVWEGWILNIGATAYGFNLENWSESFYWQANLDPELRWTGWKCVPDLSCLKGDKLLEPFLFVHDDWDRGMKILPDRITSPIGRIVRPSQNQSGHIFEWWNMLERAAELHCISSSFALLADSIDLPNNPRLFIHHYARPEPLPKFKKNWEILR